MEIWYLVGFTSMKLSKRYQNDFLECQTEAGILSGKMNILMHFMNSMFIIFCI